MDTTATHSLTSAWLARWERGMDTLRAAAKAPALFKPEYVSQVQAEVAHAEGQYRYWLAQDVAR